MEGSRSTPRHLSLGHYLSYSCLERAIDAHTSRCDVSSCMLQNQLVHGFGVHVPNPNRSSFIGLGGSRMINTKHRQNLPLHQICSQQKSTQDSQIIVNQRLLELRWIIIELQRSGNSPSLVFFVSVAIEESPPSFAWSSPKGAPLFFLLKLSLKTLFKTQLFVFLLIHLPHFLVVFSLPILPLFVCLSVSQTQLLTLVFAQTHCFPF